MAFHISDLDFNSSIIQRHSGKRNDTQISSTASESKIETTETAIVGPLDRSPTLRGHQAAL